MAILADQRTCEMTLGRHTLVGRHQHCGLRLTDRRVSSEHAVLCWSGMHWQLRDLGSSNGTRLNGSLVTPGVKVPVKQGDVLEFGSSESCWKLLDQGPPVPFARATVDGRVVTADDGWLLLPDATEPQAQVKYVDGSWRFESAEGEFPVNDQAEVMVAGRSFRLYLPPDEGDAATSLSRAPLRFSDLLVDFLVSPDEEQVQIQLQGRERQVRIVARTYHYMLVTLARARLKDRSRGVVEAECGWLPPEDLARSLRVDVGRLNVEVFRARRQFFEAGVLDADCLVERRQQQQRLLRFGPNRFEVRRLQSAPESP